jgi:hypothetical protein
MSRSLRSRSVRAAAVALAAAVAVVGVTVGARGVLAAAAADDPPTETNGGSIVEDYAYPGADQILAEHGLKVFRGDGHILFVTSRPFSDGVQCDAGQIQVEKASAVPPFGYYYCFRTVGTQGYLALEVPGTFVVRGGDRPITATAELSNGTERTYDVPANTPVPIDPGDGSELPSAVLVELRLG